MEQLQYKSSSMKFDMKESYIQEHLYRHLSSLGHTGFLNDGSVISIGETDESDLKK